MATNWPCKWGLLRMPLTSNCACICFSSLSVVHGLTSEMVGCFAMFVRELMLLLAHIANEMKR